jgi:hypothetical protein
LLYALTRSSKGAYSPGEMLEALDLKLKNTWLLYFLPYKGNC